MTGHPATRRTLGDDRGGVTTELVLLAPLLIVFLLFVVALGRLAGARLDVDGAAAQAARAASIARDPTIANTTARQTATAALAGDHVSCSRLAVSVDTSADRPGGWVAVTVACTAALADLTGLRLPAARTVSARSVAVIDQYRSTG